MSKAVEISVDVRLPESDKWSSQVGAEIIPRGGSSEKFLIFYILDMPQDLTACTILKFRNPECAQRCPRNSETPR